MNMRAIVLGASAFVLGALTGASMSGTVSIALYWAGMALWWATHLTCFLMDRREHQAFVADLDDLDLKLAEIERGFVSKERIQ